MPKLKPDPKEEARRVVRSHISANLDLYGLDYEQVALKCRFTPTTFRNKRKRPETFTLDELWSAAKELKLTPLQAASIVLGRQVKESELK